MTICQRCGGFKRNPEAEEIYYCSCGGCYEKVEGPGLICIPCYDEGCMPGVRLCKAKEAEILDSL
jgi:hypothetical protein